MAIYKYPICGYEYDEEKEGVKFEESCNVLKYVKEKKVDNLL